MRKVKKIKSSRLKITDNGHKTKSWPLFWHEYRL